MDGPDPAGWLSRRVSRGRLATKNTSERFAAPGPSKVAGGYADEHRPLAAYGALSATFAAGVAGSLLAAKAAGRDLPERLGPWDIVLAGAASHKISRLIAKDKVTSFLRAPFTRYQEDAGQGEVSEEPRGTGLQLAIGELVTCPYCMGQWVAAGLGVGLVAAPRLTRLITFIYSAETVGDFLQLAYKAAEERASA
jgi:hypothetical protein